MNKKFLYVFFTAFLVFSVMFVVSSCNKDITQNETTTNSIAEENLPSQTTYSESTTLSLETENDIGGADLVLHKYRQNYYCIPAPFADIVDSEEFEKWYGEIALTNPNETNVMMIKEFILHFDVSREDFERANLEWAKIVLNKLDGIPMMDPKDFSNQETDEVYNADILYTLDDSIINNYYLSHNYPYTFSDEYKKAVENGEYIPQTTDWIDIDQMEAEIIAKYGEAEIVTETTTTAEQTEAVTAE